MDFYCKGLFFKQYPSLKNYKMVMMIMLNVLFWLCQPGFALASDEDSVMLPDIIVKEKKSYFIPYSNTADRMGTAILDTPQSIQVIPTKLLEDQNVNRISEGLRNISGINQTDQSGGRYDFLIIRGFETAPEYINGKRYQRLSPPRDTANIEQIEVLKGPGSVLYGRGEPGGIVNIVTKKPLSDFRAMAQLKTGSHSFWRPSIDLTGPISENGDLLYRVNGAYESRESFRDHVESDRIFFAPAVSWQPTLETKLIFDGEFLEDTFTPDFGVVAVGDSPAPVPLERFYGEPGDEITNKDFRMGARIEHQFSKNLNLNAGFLFSRTEQDGLFTLPWRFLDEDTLMRLPIDQTYDSDMYSVYNDIIGHIKTGQLNHKILFGISYSYENSNQKEFLNLDDAANRTGIDIFNPVYGQTGTPDQLNADRESTGKAFGLYVQDQISIGEKWILSGAVRYDNFRQEIEDTLRSRTTEQEDDQISPRAGIVYKPVENLSFFAGWSRSFEPLLGTLENGDAYDPEIGEQIEGGIKYEFKPGLFATLAVFNIDKENVLTPDSDNPRFRIQTGKERSQGVEFDISGSPMKNWDIIASYAYTDARVVSDNRIAENQRISNVPYNQASLWSMYTFSEGILSGLGIGGGLFYVGERQGDVLDPFTMDSYVTADASMFYAFKNWKLSLSVKNIFDEDYYADGKQRVRVTPGDPLTVFAGIKCIF